MSTTEETHYFEGWETVNALFASNLSLNLKKIEEKLQVKLVARDNWIKVISESDETHNRVDSFFKELINISKMSLEGRIVQPEFDQILFAFEESRQNEIQKFYQRKIKVSPRKREIVARTKAQFDYIDMIAEKDIVFGIGPAGTGKTYVAMAMAISDLLAGRCSRIILTRPAIEAGENLGFLPGTLEDKIMPYLRPLYDALYEMLEFEEVNALIERNVIEVAPLAFMRGRTLNNAFVILDEAQNTTVSQMMMFLTRLGFDSHCVITGDPTQNDLPKNHESGLLHATRVLGRVDEIGVTSFNSKDVVRHPLVEKIINAYNAYESSNKSEVTQ